MSAVIALCQEVSLLCDQMAAWSGSKEEWPLKRMAELLERQLRMGYDPHHLLSLAIAAILELSRNQSSTEQPTTEPTSGNTCARGEPPLD